MTDEVQRSLGRIEGKLDMALDDLHDMKDRVQSLEGTRSYALGVIAAVATAFGVVGSYIGKAMAAVIGVH